MQHTAPQHTASTLPARRMTITLSLAAMGEGATPGDLSAWHEYVKAYWGPLADVYASTQRRQVVVGCAGSLEATAGALVIVDMLWERYRAEMVGHG